ncbi:MAG TPA: hypothetical protein VIX35_09845, partial [Vicinamibacterales bacterium]
VLYWAHLFRGRASDDLGRFADAEGAYRAALVAWPSGQSAAVGLALDLMRQGRTAEAAGLADAVPIPRQHSSDAVVTWGRLVTPPPAPPTFAPIRSDSGGGPWGDPWPDTYTEGDMRFFQGWIDALREAIR